MNVSWGRWVTLVLLLIIGVAVTAVKAQPTPPKPLQVVKPTIYYQAETNTTTLLGLLQQPAAAWQQMPAGEAVSFGYTPQAYWFKVSVGANDADRILYLGYPLLDSIDVYFVQAGQVLSQVSMGDQYPFAQRPIHNKNFVVPLPTHAAHDIYLRVQTESSLRFPLEIWPPLQFMEFHQYQVAATGLYFGLILCMVFYNLFTYLVTRDRSFLNYSAYTLSVGLLMAGLDGVGYQYLWPGSVWIQDRIVTMIGSIMILFATLVTMGVLQTKQHSARLHRVLRFFMALYGVIFLLSLILPYAVLIPFVLGFAVICCGFLLSCGIILWRRGLIYARIYTFALGGLLAAISINALGYLGLFESVFVQRYAIMAASAFEVLLLSWALALRFNESRQEQLGLKEQLNHQLEDMVTKRTQELKQVMLRLQKANQELEQKSNEDGLTGLYNRRFLNQEFKREFRRSMRSGRELTLIMLDIDHFKPLNDSHGHLVGDQILIELAQVLRQLLRRASDTVYRYGGEEFVVLLPDTDEIGARDIAMKIAEKVRQHAFDTDQGEMRITVSMGVAVARPGVYDQPTQLLAAADEALYRAKAAGRDQIRVVAKRLASD
ncbi:sensor domain-containing diguanylate cyclase [Pseudidiomarina sp. WS423]|uniref:sensor domain-containing diguanylate cyclase n=1 Tax=Pseudidiomarina sp. WS423 TaxID=3425124 RepID=UPI003D6F37EA